MKRLDEHKEGVDERFARSIARWEEARDIFYATFREVQDRPVVPV